MKRTSIRFAGASLAATALLAVAPAAAANGLKIENLKNTGGDMLTAEDVETAVPLPERTVSPEALEEMKERFRELSPGAPEIERKSNLKQQGVPERVDNPNAANPYWSTGRLIFRKADGNLYACTAQFTEDFKVVLTAAHCVYDTDDAHDWNRDFLFQRGYTNGVSTQDVGWKCMSLFTSYHTPSENFAYDYAFILTDVDDGRPPLALRTGEPEDDAITAVGYPNNYDQGRYLYKVDGQWSSISGGIVTMKGNPMRSGNSGGAWFANFKVDGGVDDNLVISLNSHHLESVDDEENGPLFTADTERLMEHVRQAKCDN